MWLGGPKQAAEEHRQTELAQFQTAGAIEPHLEGLSSSPAALFEMLD